MTFLLPPGIKGLISKIEMNKIHYIKYIKLLTKRSILSISSKIIVPIGLLPPITTWLKLLFQLICSNKTPWDQEILYSICHKWLKLVRQLWILNKLLIPRQNINVIKDQVLRIELHEFYDSSLRVFGGLVYLRVVSLSGCFV